MPKHHSPEQMGIPERTLYAWRREFWKQQVLQRKPIFESPQYIRKGNLDEDLFALRNDLIKYIHYLSEIIASGVAPLLLDKIRAQIGLVNGVMKLDAFLKPRRPDLYGE